MLGRVRDVDVFSADLEAELACLDAGGAVIGAGVLERIEKEREQAGEALIAALESDRYMTLLEEVEAAAEAPPTREADIPLERLAAKEFRKLRKRVHALGDRPSSAALHKLRIRVKRARYAAELGAGQSGRRGRRFVDRAKKLQDTLGEHQDAVVAEQTIRELSRTTNDPAAGIGAGRLIERQHERRAAARADLSKRWKRLNRAGKRLSASRT
jgi:CHAD domain-containing protein